nr:hypothetical protein BHI3_04560 [Bacteriovorax sp. HI3]
MKNLISLFVLSILLIQAGCSSFTERSPAQVDSEYFQNAFSFSATVKGKTNHKETIEKVISENISLGAYNKNDVPRSEFVASKSLPKGEAFHLELDIDPKTSQLVYRIYHAPGALQDDVASYALMDFFSKILDSGKLDTRQAIFEMYYNARQGDPIAIDNFLKLRDSEQHYIHGIDNAVFNSDEYQKASKDIKNQRSKIASEIKALKAQRAKDKAKRKSILDALDKAPEAKQFRTLIAKNDRAGAASILKKYLPWEEMAPFEKNFWETYLEVIEKPVPLEQRVLIYRGLDGDYIHRAVVKGKELTEKEAIIQNKAFIMSSGMVKNQGSWNRRLRSLESMNDKFIATTSDGSNEFAQVARISTIFKRHSENPKGSPFLSYTPNFDIADNFGGEKVSAYLLDPRLLNFNYASSFDNEIEYLVPLNTFPDELVGIADIDLLPEDKKYARLEYLDNQLEKLIASEFGEAKKKEVLLKIKKNTYDFFKGEYDGMVAVPGKSPAASNLAFYKKFLTKGDPKPPISPKGEMNCKDLIELFWMAN